MTTPPLALTIAGSDSGGGAGIQADLKTMLALGVHGMSVITAVTAQNSLGVSGFWELPTEAIAAQLTAVLGDIGADAIKTGMLASAPIIETVHAGLAGVSAPIVIDPVAVSKHGDRLVDPAAFAAMRELLFPIATVVTPNLPEVASLTGIDVTSRQDMQRAAEALLALGPTWVVVKGGHLEGPEAIDLATDGTTTIELTSPRYDNRHTHGTGCTFASAIASYLARGENVPEALRGAKQYVSGAIQAGFKLGSGIGPVDHAWALPTSRDD